MRKVSLKSLALFSFLNLILASSFVLAANQKLGETTIQNMTDVSIRYAIVFNRPNEKPMNKILEAGDTDHYPGDITLKLTFHRDKKEIMHRLSSLAFRNLWSRKLRTLVTGFGIVLGVATVLAFGITNATTENSLNDFFSQTAGDADLTISSSDLGQTFRARALGQAAEFPNAMLAVGSLWKDGDLRLADEVFTPDSSRYWRADTYRQGVVQPSFDKQFVRNWLTSPESGWDRYGTEPPPPLPPEIAAATRDRYIEAYERISGLSFNDYPVIS